MSSTLMWYGNRAEWARGKLMGRRCKRISSRQSDAWSRIGFVWLCYRGNNRLREVIDVLDTLKNSVVRQATRVQACYSAGGFYSHPFNRIAVAWQKPTARSPLTNVSETTADPPPLGPAGPLVGPRHMVRVGAGWVHFAT